MSATATSASMGISESTSTAASIWARSASSRTLTPLAKASSSICSAMLPRPVATTRGSADLPGWYSNATATGRPARRGNGDGAPTLPPYCRIRDDDDGGGSGAVPMPP